MTQITYVPEPTRVRVYRLDWQIAGLFQTASGYGRKLTTGYQIQLPGDPPWRWRRVYAVCYSNAASYYVLIRGEARYLSGALWATDAEVVR